MAKENYYALIAVVELHSNSNVTIESISVSQRECVLTGAWEFTINNKEDISNVVSGKLIIPLGNENKVKELLANLELKFIQAKPFLDEASKAASDAIAAFENFKSNDQKKRKKMVKPSFFNWPADLDFNKSLEFLESIGKMAVPLNTPEEMKKTLAAAKLVKFLIDMWQSDEQERNNRKYVEGAAAEITILPHVWLREFAPI